MPYSNIFLGYREGNQSWGERRPQSIPQLKVIIDGVEEGIDLEELAKALHPFIVDKED